MIRLTPGRMELVQQVLHVQLRKRQWCPRGLGGVQDTPSSSGQVWAGGPVSLRTVVLVLRVERQGTCGLSLGVHTSPSLSCF